MLGASETDRLLELEKSLKEQQIRNDELRKTVASLVKQQEALSERVFHRNRHRWDTIEIIADYLLGAQLSGDYAEFGVYQGETFAHACNFIGPMFSDVSFWAFDSFKGLPRPKSDIDEHDGYSGGFFEGQFSCSKIEFTDNLIKKSVDLKRVKIVDGWYDETLTNHYFDRDPSLNLKTIAVAWIDCDLYDSTVPVLNFITDKITVGSVILFDDWRCFRNQHNHGQQRACHEWLERNPNLKLNHLTDYGYNGCVFTVSSC